MSKKFYVVPVIDNSPVWPAHNDQSGALVVRSVSCVGQGPIVGTWEALIDADDFTAIDADGRWEFVEDAVEEGIL